MSEGLLPANYLLVRGAGQYVGMPSFDEKYGLRAHCVAGGGLYKGLGRYLGMKVIDVPGANALPDSNLNNKIDAVLDSLEGDCDFVFLHIKATDSLGEDGNWKGKRDFILRIDEAFGRFRERMPENVLLAVTGDHSTPCAFSTAI